MSRALTLPDFLSIFHHIPGDQPHLSLNPNFNEANDTYRAWLQTKASDWSPEVYKIWAKTEVALCTAFHCPRAGLVQLQNYLIPHYVLLCMMETMTDTTSYACGAFDVQTLFPVDEPSLILAEISNDPSVRTIAELVRTSTSKIPRPYRDAVIRETKILAQAMMAESTVRETGITTVETYISHRQLSIGMRPCFNIIRWATGVLLGDDILASDPVYRMTRAACELMAMTNDLCSYKKEVRLGEALHNLVTVCMLDPSTNVAMGDLPAAFNFVEEKTRNAMQELEHATALAMQKWPGESKSLLTDEHIDNREHIQLYANVLMEAVVGNYFWHVDPRVKRYSVFADEESRRTRTITLPN
ncbi:isoprenoid synthase domain-containing protein [Mycena rebaudengoi]|nr:isoprenoid synthase domain-containing protein [Mycena rebaudengoi]